MRAVSRWAARVLAGFPLAMLLLASGPAASAHPFGDPQTAEISQTGNTVRVQWQPGGLDDLTLLALQLGLLPEERTTRYLDGAVFFEESDAVALAESREFAAYLIDMVGVRSSGAECPGQVESTAGLAEQGAVIAFSCPSSLDSAEVTLRMLTDLHSAYRTLASAEDGQRFVYTSSAPTHTWVFGGSADASAEPAGHGERSAAFQLSAVVGAAVVAVVAGAWVRRRQAQPE